MNLRDPVLYRILHAEHPRTGNAWCIYPTYDFAHGQSDAIEGITHSLCTLEFEDHRPLYDWLIENLPVPARPHQYEFARLNIAYTVLSKRILTRLVSEGRVTGWDDPRMPTLAGLRRRGVPAAAMRDFVRRSGIAKANSVVEFAMFEYRDPRTAEPHGAAAHGGAAPAEAGDRELARGPAPRRWRRSTIRRTRRPARGRSPSGASSTSSATTSWRTRRRSSSASSPGREVRLRYAYFVTCREVVKNARRRGGGTALHLRSGDARRQCAAGRAQGAGDAALGRGGGRGRRRRCGSTITCSPAPIRARTATSWPISIRTRWRCCAAACSSRRWPRRRSARRCSSSGWAISARDPDSAPGRPVFNRTVGLRDTWAKVQGRGA